MQAGEPPQTVITAYDDAPAYWAIGILWNVLISGDESVGSFTLMDQTMPEGAGPPAHMHERSHEGFYILEGEITFSIGGAEERSVAVAGTAVWIPPRTPHAFKVTSPEARALNFYTPGGFDDRFRFLGVPATEKTLPPSGLPEPDPRQSEEYLARLRDLHQETFLADERSW